MDLFSMFLHGAMSWGVGRILEVVTRCFRCGQQDERDIGNVQTNWLECSNCHEELEQFTNACDFTVDRRSQEIGHAIWGPWEYKYEWVKEGGIFQPTNHMLRIPFRIRTRGLSGRAIVVETELSRYRDESFITSHESVIYPSSNATRHTCAHLYPDSNFDRDDQGIIAVDIRLMSEYKDVLYEDRRIIKPWR